MRREGWDGGGQEKGKEKILKIIKFYDHNLKQKTYTQESTLLEKIVKNASLHS